MAGFQAVVLWQLTQFAVVGICAAVLPVAVLPLWQLEQLVELVKLLWSMPVAGVQADVLWQVLHAAWVAMCPEGLPVVVVPLWQLEHAPGGTPTWSNFAPEKVTVVWQDSHPKGV